MLNAAEYATKVSNDTALTAVVYLVVSYDMRADSLFRPTLFKSLVRCLELINMARFSAIFLRKVFTLKSITSDTYSTTL